MLSFYRGTERIMDCFFFYFLKRLKRGNPAPPMPCGPLHKEEVHLRGVSRVAMETGEPPPRGVATGRNQERGDKMDARYSNLAEARGGGSLTGPRLKKVPRLNLDTTQRAGAPPSPQNNRVYLPNY